MAASDGSQARQSLPRRSLSLPFLPFAGGFRGRHIRFALGPIQIINGLPGVAFVAPGMGIPAVPKKNLSTQLLAYVRAFFSKI